ncbi:MAG: taurine transporter substrate binding subunit [Methanosaeta sp. PtaU1.Bin060]|nr:MAG: taurine transporter substrate binding subunit [Methanosaeta sp. PtaU1.Bin060]
MRKIIIVAMLAAVVVVSLGCIFAPENENVSGVENAPAKITTLRIGYQPSTHQIAEMVASAKGWWAEDLKPFGVEKIEEKEFQSGPPEMQAMLAGALDIAYVGTAPPITAISQGLDAKIVAAVNINGSDLVLRTDENYSGPQSLVGKSIGTFPPGSIQDIVMKKWLKDNNVDASKIDIHPMGPGEAVTAIEAGKVDGVFLPHPSPAKVAIDGKGESVVPSGEMWPNHACCSLLVSGKLLREQPELVDQIIKTHINATDYINAHPEEAAKIYAERTKQDLSVAEESVKNWDGKWVSDPSIEIPSTVEYARVDKQLGYINKSLTEDDLFDTSFYEKAKA